MFGPKQHAKADFIFTLTTLVLNLKTTHINFTGIKSEKSNGMEHRSKTPNIQCQLPKIHFIIDRNKKEFCAQCPPRSVGNMP